MNQFQISLLLLAYNDEKTITSALESIFQQNIFKQKISIELIILPNGCRDRTVELINNFIKSADIPSTLQYRSIIIPEGDRNKALNRGIKESKGQYIFYVNSDCTISSGALKAVFDLLDNNKSIQVVGLNDTPNIDHFLPDSLIKGMFEVLITTSEIKEKIVPIGRFIGIRNGLIDSVPENIHSEDIWLDLFVAKKFGLSAIKVVQTEYVYWTPPADWSSYINLFARYERGMTQLFETHPESLIMFQKLIVEIKQKTTIELRSLIIERLIKKGKTLEKATELFELYLNVVKIIKEQEKILNISLIDPNSGKWKRDF